MSLKEVEVEDPYCTDLTGKSPFDVADLIAHWRDDPDALFESTCDLLRSIENWLRGLDNGE